MTATGPSLPSADPAPLPAVLPLVLKVSLLQAWRRLKAIRRQSKLLSLLIAVFVLGYALLAFTLFGIGLRFVGAFPGLGYLLVERLMFLLFAFLFVLLVFSNLVISYTNLFRNRETTFLLTLPVPRQTVFRWKLIESTLLASWAFVFLVSPLLAAYGLHSGVPWHFYAVVPLLLALFIVLPGILGAWSALHVARFLDRRTFQVLGLLTALLVIGASAVWLRTQPVTDTMLETRVLEVLDRLLVKTRFAQFPFLPSYWLSSSVLRWAEGAVAGSVFFLLVLLSYALFFGYLACTRTGGLFYDAVSSVQSRGNVFWQWGWFHAWRRHRLSFAYAVPWLDRTLAAVPFLTRDLAGLIAKDIRIFWRDTTQWGQTLVLFGLLGVYVLNLRHFSHQLSNPFWIHLVSYLNLGACSLNLATLTTRFVYPQFSLEGKRVWIVGMAPLGLVRLVRAKYALASIASLTVTLGLMLLSRQMLHLGIDRTAYFVAAVGVMTFALNGLAVGLGVLYPNLREDHPGRIVSGFGGTLCLVLSFVYIVGSVVLLAIGTPWPWVPEGLVSDSLVGTCAAAFAALSLLVGWLPLLLALRHARHIELF